MEIVYKVWKIFATCLQLKSIPTPLVFHGAVKKSTYIVKKSLLEIFEFFENGFPFIPYCLKRYFDTDFCGISSEGFVLHYLLGHIFVS